MTIDTRQLAALAAVLRTGSFEMAADELSITGSALSQRVRQLEERLGTVLVVRGSPCRATPAGARVYTFAQEMAMREQLLFATLDSTSSERMPSITIALNADSLASWFLSAIDGFDQLLFHIVVDDQMDGTGMLSRGEAVAAVTPGGRQVAGCDIWQLGIMRYVPVARPDFAARHFPGGISPEALASAPAITYDEKDRLQADWIAARTGIRTLPPTHLVASATGLYDAAAAGLGWVMMPLPLAEPHLQRGDLVRLSEEAPIDVPLNWQVQRSARALLEDLTRRIRRGAQSHLLAAETS